MKTPSERQIIHVDMDAFFAAVEQLDRPELRGKPVVVGGDPQGRGVVSAASYEARKFGCRSAMPVARALRLCRQVVVVRPRMKRYLEVSRLILAVMEQFTPEIEPISIDEAFLDVTGSTRLLGPAVKMAADLKRRIHEETGLTASAGVAPNKFLAKIASDLEKPDGFVVVDRDRIRAFLDPLPIRRLWGVGQATLPKLEAIGVRTFADLRRLPRSTLRDRFGEAGGRFFELVRGIDNRDVVPDRAAKSISHENTFSVDVEDREHVRAVLLQQIEHVVHRLRSHRRCAKTITIKVRTGDFKTVTRRKTLAAPTDQTDLIWNAAAELFEKWSRQDPSPIRLIGTGVSHLSDAGGDQLPLFGRREESRRRELDRTVDEIRGRFGDDAVYRAGALPPGRKPSRR